MRRSLLVVVLLLLATMASAQVYKWTDAGGTVHYSETPPATGTSFKQITTNGSAPPSAKAPAVARKAGNPSETAAPAAAAQPVADTPENRDKLCTSLKANLASLEGKAPVVMQKEGKNVLLDDTERQAQVATAQKQYAQYCPTK